MNPNTVEKEALHLPAQERARLAQKLLASLDDLAESEAEQLWVEEVVRRASEIDEGEVKLVSSDELERRVQARLK